MRAIEMPQVATAVLLVTQVAYTFVVAGAPMSGGGKRLSRAAI
jgi:hypothetical protein